MVLAIFSIGHTEGRVKTLILYLNWILTKIIMTPFGVMKRDNNKITDDRLRL